jgi:hypothetical protein
MNSSPKPEPKPKSIAQERADRVKHNRKRGLRITRQVKQNQEVRNELNDWWQSGDSDLTHDEMFYFANFRRSIAGCGKNSLYRQHIGGALDYMGSHTCNHKYCSVCNAERSKRTRRAYYNFFEKNPELLDQYNFMHLTLTVPHTQEGWRGQKFYAEELTKEFNYMRKKSWWKKMVYAGEFGIELTKNDSGFHIHIHSMILVHKSTQNRNELHRKILLAWNRQTSESKLTVKRNGDFEIKGIEPLSKEQIESVKKSNKLITDSDCLKLCRTGATLIGLESLYIRSSHKKKGYLYCDRAQCYKKYVAPGDGLPKFMGGVMECIKYHFEPMAMRSVEEINEDTGEITKRIKVDFELMREILPMIYRKQLYKKFGAFHAACKNAHEDCKMLNMNHKHKPEDQAAEIIEQTAHEEVIHPETLEPVEPDQYEYCIIPAWRIWYDPDQNFKPHISEAGLKDVRRTNTNDLKQALFVMLEIGIADHIRQNEQKPIKR